MMDITQEILDKAGIKKPRRKYAYVRTIKMEQMIGYYYAIGDDYAASTLKVAAHDLGITVRPEAIEAFRIDELEQIEYRKQHRHTL